MTPGEILSDETWLDITDKHHLFRDAFHLLSTFGVKWYAAPPLAPIGCGCGGQQFRNHGPLGWPEARCL